MIFLSSRHSFAPLNALDKSALDQIGLLTHVNSHGKWRWHTIPVNGRLAAQAAD
jgi:hypothetical protein